MRLRDKLLLIVMVIVLGFSAAAYAEQYNYIRSVFNVLVHEGGARYTNHPRDPGGPTRWGITLADVRAYLKPDATAEDVRTLSREDALAIYREHYWDAVNADRLPQGLDYTVFDFAVHSGPARAGRALRRALGMPLSDWRVTPDVLAAISKTPIEPLIDTLNSNRLVFLQHLSTWDIFGRGWNNRVLSVRTISLKMIGTPIARAMVAPDISGIPRLGNGKAYEEDVTNVP